MDILLISINPILLVCVLILPACGYLMGRRDGESYAVRQAIIQGHIHMPSKKNITFKVQR